MFERVTLITFCTEFQFPKSLSPLTSTENKSHFIPLGDKPENTFLVYNYIRDRKISSFEHSYGKRPMFADKKQGVSVLFYVFKFITLQASGK